MVKLPDQDNEKHSGEAPLPPVSANTLARCLGVSPKVIYDLAKAGVIERGAGRLFPLEDSVRRYPANIFADNRAHRAELQLSFSLPDAVLRRTVPRLPCRFK